MKLSNVKSRQIDRCAGFTLVEALAALAVMACLAASVLPFFGRLAARWSYGEQATERQDEWMQAILRLSEDLGGALPLSLGAGEAPRLAFRASPNSIAFVREALADHGGVRLETVWLTIVKGDAGDALVRSSRDFDPDRFNARHDDAATTAVLAGNFHLRFSLVDGHGQRSSELSEPSELPSRVDLRAEPARAGAGSGVPSGVIVLPLAARSSLPKTTRPGASGS